MRDHDLKAAACRLASEVQPDLGPHPPPEELLAYHADSLAEAERGRLEEHLASCLACARMMIGLETALGDESPEGVVLPSDAEIAERWDEFRHRLRPARGARWLEFLRRLLAPPGLAYGLAATSVVAALVLGFIVLSLRARVAELSRPRMNVYIGDLEPLAEAVRRGEGVPARISVPATADHVLLLLNLTDLPAFPEYELEIRGGDGQKISTARGLQPTPDGNFTLELPRSFLPAGRYRLTLSGLERERRSPLVQYDLDLQYE